VFSIAALSGAWLLFAGMRSGALEWAARAVAQPLGQAALLSVIGLALACYGMYALETKLEDDLLSSDIQMELMVGQIDLGPTSEQAPTDKGRLVPLFRPSAATAEGLATFSEESFLHKRNLDQHIIQTGPVDPAYNCHGWVFAGGKFWVRGTAVPGILKDNGYRAVAHPRLGDIAIFTDPKGEVSHSGLVRGQGTKGAILLESKWGKLGRYIHTTDKHIYVGHAIAYYRTDRGSHVLSGLPDPELTTSEETE
jgi:hypothetical protein